MALQLDMKGLSTTHSLALSSDFYVGWPVTLQLADGSLITSYTIRAYLKQITGQQNVTEVVRWRLPERK